jgi:hypothetical protein
MKKNILILNDKQLAFEVNKIDKSVYVYYTFKSRLKETSKAILKTINSELANEINNYFSIDLKEYGVGIDDSKNTVVTKEQKKHIYRNTIGKYLLAFMAAFMIYIIETPDSLAPIYTQDANLFIGSLGLLGVLAVYLLVVGKEQSELNELETYAKYNMTTFSAPSKDQYIASLETKIEQMSAKDKVCLQN